MSGAAIPLGNAPAFAAVRSARHGARSLPAKPSEPVPARPFRRADLAWLVGFGLLALVARLLHLGAKPFWLDEVLTFHRVHLAAGGVVADSFANRHMPSYFLLVRWFTQIDDSAAMLRLPSALFGAAAVAVVYDIARRIGGRTAAIVAALLMALSPQQVQYGQEARSYTLEMLLIAVALWGVVRLAQAYTMPSPGVGGRRIGWVAYVAGTVGALDVLGGAMPWVLAANLAFALVWRGTADRRGFARAWFAAHGAILALCLPPYLLMVSSAVGNIAQKFDWVPKLSWHGIWVSFASTYLMRASAVVQLDLLPTTVPILAPIVAGLAALGMWRVRRRTDGVAVWFASALLPVLVLGVSLIRPMLVPRYILWSAAPFFVLAGLGAAALPRRAVPLVLTAFALFAVANLEPLYRTETKPRWDLAAARLAASSRPKDTVLTADPNAPDMLTTLQPKGKPPIAALITPQIDVAVARWKQGGRVWAVHGRSGLGDGEKLEDFKARIAALGIPVREIPLGQEITILLFPALCTIAATPAGAQINPDNDCG